MVPGSELRDKLLGNRAESDVGDGEDDHIGVPDGAADVGEVAAGLDGALLTGRGVLDVADVMGAALQVVGHSHAHLPAGSHDGDLQLLSSHAAWLLR